VWTYREMQLIITVNECNFIYKIRQSIQTYTCKIMTSTRWQALTTEISNNGVPINSCAYDGKFTVTTFKSRFSHFLNWLNYLAWEDSTSLMADMGPREKVNSNSARTLFFNLTQKRMLSFPLLFLYLTLFPISIFGQTFLLALRFSKFS
jgi:hypothetical protein